MANGLGEYFGEQSAFSAAQPRPSPAPVAGPQFAPAPVSPASVLQTPPSMRQVSGTGEYFAQNGMGMFQQNGMGAFNLGPVRPRGAPGAFRRAAGRVSPFVSGLGDATDAISDARAGAITGVAAATTVTALLFWTGLRFGAGWMVGKALAPSDESESKYAWGGALAATFFGAVGLGAEALIAANARK